MIASKIIISLTPEELRLLREINTSFYFRESFNRDLLHGYSLTLDSSTYPIIKEWESFLLNGYSQRNEAEKRLYLNLMYHILYYEVSNHGKER
jgi:hypothetical protein